MPWQGLLQHHPLTSFPVFANLNSEMALDTTPFAGMIVNLLEVMPEACKPASLEELKLLDSAVDQSYPVGTMRFRTYC
jgi:hypothetical protein